MPAPVNFPVPDPFKASTPEAVEHHLRQLAAVVRGIMEGKINAAFDFDLNVSPATTTTITSDRIRATSRVQLQPINNHARNDWAAGAIQLDEAAITSRSLVITHLPSTLTRSFRVSFLS